MRPWGRWKLSALVAAAPLLLFHVALALEKADGVPPEGFTPMGSIAARHAREIEASNWSVGAETMDRDFTVYRHWREYLGPLGVKKARIQSGWAKTEKQPGVYDWAWLDEIILDMVDSGVEPWVCLCYGNPIYPEGGGTGLGGGIPTSPEALAAWDQFVAAFVDRYAEQVDEWEVWNEPGLRGANAAETYADLLIRTAEIVRHRQQDARIIAFGMAGVKEPWVDSVLQAVHDRGKLALIDEVSYHPYSYNPDKSYPAVEKLRTLVQSYSETITLRQGENGAPSQRGSYGALSEHDWTERSQAKWALRRLLGDLGHDIPSSYFAICDMEYSTRRNYKGLLAINDEQRVHHAQLAYYAVRNLAALFDNRLVRVTGLDAELSGGDLANYALFAYRASESAPLLTIWRSNETPGVRPEMETISLALKGVTFRDPVWIDLLSGRAYDMDADCWDARDASTRFHALPVYDSPVVVAERRAVADRLQLTVRK